MGGYRDEYEDLDEYEDEEADGERYEDDGYEEEEEEEDPQPSKEVQDYLVLRQRLKEEKREQLKKELGTGNASSREKKNLILKSKDNYGSFFGSSQPVIAQRVIQESKSLLENPHLLDKAIKSKDVVKSTVSASVSSKSQAMAQTPKVTNGVHKKVQMIKNIRDYSFLDSDDAQPHEPTKDYQRKVSAPKSEAHMAQLSERNRDFLSTTGRKTPSNRDDKKSTAVNGHGQMRLKVGGHRLASHDRHKQTPSDTRKPLPVSNGTTSHDRKQVPDKIGSGPGRLMVSKSVPSKIPGGAADKRISMPAAKSSTSHVHKLAFSKPQHQQPHPASELQQRVSKQQTSISKQSFGRREHERKQNLLPKQAAHEELRRHNALPKQVSHEELRKQKVLPRQGAPVLKPKVTLPPPKGSARPTAPDDRNRKRPMRPRDDDDDPEDAIRQIRNLFGYNPSKYRNEDYDDRNMEANYEQIAREEKRSARIARQEDDEELRKLEEEDRRERMRKESKKRKLH